MAFATGIALIIISSCARKAEESEGKLSLPRGETFTVTAENGEWEVTITQSDDSAHFEITDKNGHQAIFNSYAVDGVNSSTAAYTAGPKVRVVLDSRKGVVSASPGSDP